MFSECKLRLHLLSALYNRGEQNDADQPQTPAVSSPNLEHSYSRRTQNHHQGILTEGERQHLVDKTDPTRDVKHLEILINLLHLTYRTSLLPQGFPQPRMRHYFTVH
jgi:hypothetical protein